MNHEYRLFWQLISTVYTVTAVSVGVATTVYFSVSTSSPSHAQFHEVFFALLYAVGTAAVVYLAWHARQVAASSPQEVTHTGEGFNIYLRVGLVVFLAGSVALNLMRCTAAVLAATASCGSRTAGIVMSLLEAIFTVSQAAFILRHHRAVFLQRKAQNRMALAHLFTANICIWASSAIGEIKEKFEEKPHHASSNRSTSTSCSEHAATSEAAAAASSLLESAQPFLIPAVIEYCLLCAPMVLHLMACVGDHRSFAPRQDQKDAVVDSDEGGPASSSTVGEFLRKRFVKSRRGLAFCLATLVVTIGITIAVYLVLDGWPATAAYLCQDLLLGSIGSVLCIMVYQRLKLLGLAKCERHSFDDKLLTFALFGALIYQVTLASVFIDHAEVFPPIYLAAELITQASCCLQLLLQSVCLLDGLRRRANSVPATVAKPGRSYVMALLGINLSMWIMETFEVRKAEELMFSYRLENVSLAALQILVHIGQPINIFYRFHSTVCLSIIWRKAYELHSHEEGICSG